jgi:hypothetical protein
MLGGLHAGWCALLRDSVFNDVAFQLALPTG